MKRTSKKLTANQLLEKEKMLALLTRVEKRGKTIGLGVFTDTEREEFAEFLARAIP